jgi:hypothetical protein
MVRSIKPVLVMLGLSIALTVIGQAQTITFVQIEIPNLREASPGDSPESERYVRNLSALSAAVLETNRTALHRPLDFVLLSGGGESLPPDAKVAANSLAPLLAGLSTPTVLLAFDSPASAPTDWPSTLLKELGSKMPGRIVDIRSKSVPRNGIDLTYVNSAAVISGKGAQGNAEMTRLGALLATNVPVVLFASSMTSPSATSAGNFWSLAGVEKTEWNALLRTPNLLAVFANEGCHPAAVIPDVSTKKLEFDSPVDRHIVHPLPSLEEPYDQTGSSRGILLVSLNAAGRVETKPIPLVNRFSEDPRDLQDVLIQAQVNEKNEEYAAAYNFYGGALKSKDPDVRTAAEAGLHRTDDKLQGFWERLRRDSVAVEWIWKHRIDLAIAAFLVAISLVWLIFRYRRRAIPAFCTPSKLNDGAPSELFELCIHRETKGIRDIWHAAQTPLKAGPDLGVDLSLGADVPGQVLEALPKLIGDESTSTLKLIFFFWRYFSWRVESSVYGSEENAAVYVRLCWGWVTRSSWVLPAIGKEPIGIRECAEKIAYNLSAEGMLKR